ncbi:hypothetical protein MPTK1_6g16460 [Marchantia polymorpha subsp. ruderalis]|uniref:Uncharacterized protein n=2 Tax=Marchantia polymorpha TaxID=3197 RepID=A0A176WL86_MARPO|nr:hypothetical protein AXG93_1952s1030 [Marchantia polymorpha subsp. ruderalis]PTQ28227.1 hypothetical protein MARPO_0170s0031 [Marchantia polymorpha]BBN15040.1 hypothetical protein Mp_6g16460 [Marchantia polymorpha subsp. ruderalis]|eukprot:PTQ28227.1 hypothetical protein MARPO_0170s0031 [Marchantia polymorpha]
MASLSQPAGPTGLYPSVPTYDDVKKKERHRAMEDYGHRPDVYDMLFRFLNDLLTAQPKDPLEFMLKWASLEAKNPNKLGPPLKVDLSGNKYSLNVDLGKREQVDQASREKRPK